MQKLCTVRGENPVRSSFPLEPYRIFRDKSIGSAFPLYQLKDYGQCIFHIYFLSVLFTRFPVGECRDDVQRSLVKFRGYASNDFGARYFPGFIDNELYDYPTFGLFVDTLRFRREIRA